MTRQLIAAGVLLVAAGFAPAADGPPTGLWKLRLNEGGRPLTFLLNFTETDGNWVGDFIAGTIPFPEEPSVTDVAVDGGHVAFTMKFQGRVMFTFDGVAAEDGKTISGTLAPPAGIPQLTDLRATQLKNLDDPFAVAREEFAQAEVGPPLFNSGFVIVSQAAEKMLTPDEIRAIADRLTTAAAKYGPRWERSVATRLADDLAGQDGFADIALAQARRAERMMTDATPPADALKIIDTLARVLTKADQADEAEKYRGLAARLELRDFADSSQSSPLADVPAFAGRTAAGDRVALVEVFTSADAEPVVAVDLVEGGLLKAFQPSDMVLLTYHVHAPAPSPLAAQESMERFGFYAENEGLRGIPAVIVDGTPAEAGGGPASVAKERFDATRKLVEAAIEKPAAAKLTLVVTPTEAGFSAKAYVAGLAAPGEKVRLRFAVVEPRVRYEGASGTRYHRHVVRAMPGGAAGFPLTEATAEQAVTVNPTELRATLNKNLDDFAASEKIEFPRPERPLALAGLKLIAFVQNDETKEVLQAVQVDLAK